MFFSRISIKILMKLYFLHWQVRRFVNYPIHIFHCIILVIIFIIILFIITAGFLILMIFDSDYKNFKWRFKFTTTMWKLDSPILTNLKLSKLFEILKIAACKFKT